MTRAVRFIVALGAAVVLWAAVGGAGAGAASDNKQRERARRALREGEFEVAEKIYRELLERDPKDLPARLGLGYAQYKQRNLHDAYDNAARVLAVDPLSARAHALLGSALLGSGEFQMSIEEFRTAVGLNDRDALAIAGLSMINFYENRPSVALVGLRRAVELEPDEPDFLFNYAQAAARSERYQEAADAYEQFLRIAPKTDADRRARIRGLIDFLRYLGAQSRPLYETEGPSHVELPFELANSRPIITVRINNSKKPLRLVIDTGSGMCVLAHEAAERLGVKAIARGGMARAVGGGGRFEIVYGFLNMLQVGEAKIYNVPVYLREFHNEQEPVDGYIGLTVLSRYLATVDYGKKMLVLTEPQRNAPPATATLVAPLPAQQPTARPDATAAQSPSAPQSAAQSAAAQSPAQPPPPGGQPAAGGQPAPTTQEQPRVIELPIRSTSSGFWSGAVKLEGVARPANFIIDTGASISVVSQQLAERESLGRFEQKGRPLRVFGAAGVSEGVPMLVIPVVRVGTYAHPHFTAAVLDMAPINETSGFEQTGILGGNVLRFFRVTFDFNRGIVRLEMIPGYVPPPLPREANISPQSY
jgi:tetratricopeptide (TPR) repeat protein